MVLEYQAHCSLLGGNSIHNSGLPSCELGTWARAIDSLEIALFVLVG